MRKFIAIGILVFPIIFLGWTEVTNLDELAQVLWFLALAIVVALR